VELTTGKMRVFVKAMHDRHSLGRSSIQAFTSSDGRCHNFKISCNMQKLQYLLAYRFIAKGLELIMIGPHENYYRDLKGYLKGR
jgi:hypothetical protein